MYASYTNHKSSSSNSSCAIVVDYLEKENKVPNQDGLILKENFFNSDYNSTNLEQEIEKNKIISDLNNNRGTRKETESNFYMLNIAPSPNELKHMEKIAEEKLKENKINKDISPPASEIYYNEQKEQLMKMQLKFYVKDVMVEYANNFNREIYVDESILPSNYENQILNKETDIVYNKYLKERGIDIENKINEKVPGDKFIRYTNCKILEESSKAKQIEITLKDGEKGIVNVPIKTAFLDKDNSIKMLESVYNEKSKEVLLKNTLKEIDYKMVESKYITIEKKEIKVFNFEKKDDRFKEPLKFSVQEKDLINKDGKYFISEHLQNEKLNYSLKKGVEKEFSEYRKTIYNELATKKGFDFTKRPLTEKDLLWYAKVETNRTYKHTDKEVKLNKPILAKIDKLQKNPNLNMLKIKNLEKHLITDKNSKEVIKEGVAKGGLNYHAHILVSRHDKTMQNSRNKISLSPSANQKDSTMSKGAQVGFDRTKFAEKIEKVFDEKFDYNRPVKEKFVTLNNNKLTEKVKGMTKDKAKQFLMKHTGLSELKKELGVAEPLVSGIVKNRNIVPGVINKIKQDIGIANIPTQIPKGIVDLAVKVAKKILSQGIEM